jgi:H+/Cl- antiporter ClcA
MRRQLAEQTVIFVSVVKWIALATMVGSVVGFSTNYFIRLLNWSIAYAREYPYYFLLMPAAFLASVLIIKYFAPEAEGHGTEKIIEAIHKRSGKVKFAVVPVKLIATIITIGLGGSAGKEGPAAQIGAALASKFADIFRFDDTDRKKLVICGISAGFSAVFGTPIGGAIFGVEVLFAGSILYEVLLPSFIAGITAYQVSTALGLTYFYHPLAFVPVFQEAFFLKVTAAGICFGLVSMLLIETMAYSHKMSLRLRLPWWLRPVAGGLVLALLALVVSDSYLGLGLNTIESSLRGFSVPWYAFIVKTIFTSVTLGFGGSGGIVTPIFFIGATAGSTFGHIFGLDPATFAAIGLVSLLAGCANTPISASIMAVELFGPKLAPYATVACIISFLMTGHRSVYPSQILSIRKSPSVEVELGQEIISAVAHVHPRKKSFTGAAIKVVQALKVILKHKDHKSQK